MRPLSSYSYFTYTLNNALYVPFTSRCTTRQTLPSTRGPNFLMPSEAVASLCRLRDVERQLEGCSPKWEPWCQWLDTVEYAQKLPNPMEPLMELPIGEPSPFLPGEDGRRPTVSELWKELEPIFADKDTDQESDDNKQHISNISSIVIAGEGEPLLRLSSLLQLVKTIRQTERNKNMKQPMSLRINTNGLVRWTVDDFSEILKDYNTGKENDDTTSKAILDAANVPELLYKAGINVVSVAIMTHDANQYNELMGPIVPDAHAHVCRFVQQAVSIQKLQQENDNSPQPFHVELTAVDRSDVDKKKTQKFVESLGVTAPIRWRPYFP